MEIIETFLGAIIGVPVRAYGRTAKVLTLLCLASKPAWAHSSRGTSMAKGYSFKLVPKRHQVCIIPVGAVWFYVYMCDF